MINELKDKLLTNKDDLIEGTFCYTLFEDSIFDENLMQYFIDDVKKYLKKVEYDSDIKDLLIWVLQCVEQCFISHHDKDDLYFIKNYSDSLENTWQINWKKEIENIIQSS